MISKLKYLFIESSINSIGIWGRSCEVDGGGDAGDELGGGGMRGGEAGGGELGRAGTDVMERSTDNSFSVVHFNSRASAPAVSAALPGLELRISVSKNSSFSSTLPKSLQFNRVL